MDNQSNGSDHVILYLVSAEKYVQVNVALLKKLVHDEKMHGVYITINRPYQNLLEIFKKNGVPVDHIFFIDAITKMTGGKETDAPNCIFLDSPTNLTDITIAVKQAISLMGDAKKFIFVDALSTLLIYNEGQTVIKFAHFLTGRMREWKTEGIIISIQKEMDERLTSQLIQFCDKKIEAYS